MNAENGSCFGSGNNGNGGKIVVKPGRINGHNSTYRSGSHPIKRKVRYELVQIMREHLAHGVRKSTVGQETMDDRKEAIENFFSDLFFLRYNIESVHNLKQKHLAAVYQFLEAQGQAPATLQNKISHMRIFCEWIGKPGMVVESSSYVVNPLSTKRTMVVQEDRSWSGNGVDVMEMIEKIRLEDEKVAAVLYLNYGFGLRLKEAVMMNIFKSVDGNVLTVVHGTKGGRIRSVPIEHEWQHRLLEVVRGVVDQTTGKLAPRGKTVDQAERRVRTLMEKYGLTMAQMGVTPHGLRHQYMQERFKELTGVEAPIKGGDISVLDKQTFDEATGKLMERAGHSRLSIGASYYGSRRMKKKA
ncbi:MAG: tyrosine-type recombinase/integrase [Burkholderiales bacterium]